MIGEGERIKLDSLVHIRRRIPILWFVYEQDGGCSSVEYVWDGPRILHEVHAQAIPRLHVYAWGCDHGLNVYLKNKNNGL